MSHLTSFQSVLRAHGFDAALVSDERNQRYLAGFPFSDGLLLIPASGDAYLLTDSRYIEAAKAQAADGFAVLAPAEGIVPCVGSLLSSSRCKTVAVEEDTLSVASFERWKKRFSDVKLLPGASETLSRLRERKDDLELQTVARAQEITDAAFSHILSVLHPEMTEIDVALELDFFMRRNGAERVAFDTIAVSGANSSRPHGVPQNIKLQKGFLTMDFGAVVDGYCSDMTRTVVLGKADAEMKRLYDTVLSAQKAALGAAAEGISCREIDKVARDLIDGAGYAGCFGHSLGHGVGLYIHESPRLSPAADPDSRLERGNVVTFEPGIYLEGRYGCRIEDLCAVTNDGRLIDFTKSPKELIELF